MAAPASLILVFCAPAVPNSRAFKALVHIGHTPRQIEPGGPWQRIIASGRDDPGQCLGIDANIDGLLHFDSDLATGGRHSRYSGADSSTSAKGGTAADRAPPSSPNIAKWIDTLPIM